MKRQRPCQDELTRADNSMRENREFSNLSWETTRRDKKGLILRMLKFPAKGARFKKRQEDS